MTESSDTPLVSIIIPTFNVGELLRETLSSLRRQSYTNWEAIVVDDGSTDTTLEIAEHVASEDTRIHVYKRTSRQKGASVCRNEGIDYAGGEYALFLDGDDWLLPNCLKRRLDFAASHREFAFWVFQGHRYSVSLQRTTQALLDTSAKTADQAIYLFLKWRYPWMTTNTLWLTREVRNLGGFDPSFQRLQDIELHVRAVATKEFLISTDSEGDFCYRGGHHRRGGRHLATQLMAFRHFITEFRRFFIQVVGGRTGEKYQKWLSGILDEALSRTLKYSHRLSLKDTYQMLLFAIHYPEASFRHRLLCLRIAFRWMGGRVKFRLSKLGIGRSEWKKLSIEAFYRN